MFANAMGSHERVECGLFVVIQRDVGTKEIHPIPLQSVDVLASVVHAVSQVEVTQVFVNREEQPIEATYFFPIDSNGAVTHFEAEIEGRKIKGSVKAHEEAKQEYEKAVASDRTAFLGEENKPDIFKIRVGCLKPGNQAKITLGYVSEVKNEKGSNAIRFFIPTTVAPRYVPQKLEDGKSCDLRDMAFSENSPAPMSIKVNVLMQGDIKSVESPTHKIDVTNRGPIPEKTNWTTATVELSGKTTDMDRDFVLLIALVDPHKPRLYLEKMETSLAIMAHLIPSFKLEEQKAEFIFVLDRSGSMEGQSILLAKKALALFLHSLPCDCYFNIVGFGSSYKLLFPKSVKYDDGSLKRALIYADELDAKMGGTEILEPLSEILAAETVPGYRRQIFVITDGQVGNTEEVIGITRAKAHESRVFALGIGDSASHHLVEGIAEAGGGTSFFVTYNEMVDKKVLHQLKDALQPSLTNVRIMWEGVKPKPHMTSKFSPMNTVKTLTGSSSRNDGYLQVPENIPPTFNGSQLLIFGVFEDPHEKPTGAVISADSPDGPLSFRLEISDANDGRTGMIHTLAAIKIVREIEMKLAALSFGRFQSVAQRKEQEAVYKSDVVHIAVKAGITSQYTSFVAVDTCDKAERPVNWAMQTRSVPSQMVYGWDDSDQEDVQIMDCSSHELRSRAQRSRCSKLGKRFLGGPYRKKAAFDCREPDSESLSKRPPVVSRSKAAATYKYFKTTKANEILHKVVSFQLFDGSFKWGLELIQSLGLDAKSALEDAETRNWDVSAWATALAMTFFSEKLKEEVDSWELIAIKAKKWLEINFPAQMDAMLVLAKQRFESI